MLIGARLKELRDKRNLRQIDLANMLGVDRSTYTQYETGKSEPDFAVITKLADFYGVSTDYLLGRTNIRNYGDNKKNSSEDEKDVFNEAARKVGYEGPLTDEDRKRVEIAVRIALTKNNK